MEKKQESPLARLANDLPKKTKTMIAIVWVFITMVLGSVDTDYTELSHVLGLFTIWIITSVLVFKIDWKS